MGKLTKQKLIWAGAAAAAGAVIGFIVGMLASQLLWGYFLVRPSTPPMLDEAHQIHAIAFVKPSHIDEDCQLMVDVENSVQTAAHVQIV
ncbi:MAG: hypothetical protein JXR76_04055 [Deltaproteobacteria bacterium]|nr:hypothetical protein [Deltaproteobacteria bacterium]